jgi:hypothetical protein
MFVLLTQKKSLIPIIIIGALTFILHRSAEVGTKNFVYHTSRNSFASTRICKPRLCASARKLTRTRRRAISGLVIQIHNYY